MADSDTEKGGARPTFNPAPTSQGVFLIEEKTVDAMRSVVLEEMKQLARAEIRVNEYKKQLIDQGIAPTFSDFIYADAQGKKLSTEMSEEQETQYDQLLNNRKKIEDELRNKLRKSNEKNKWLNPFAELSIVTDGFVDEVDYAVDFRTRRDQGVPAVEILEDIPEDYRKPAVMLATLIKETEPATKKEAADLEANIPLNPLNQQTPNNGKPAGKTR